MTRSTDLRFRCSVSAQNGAAMKLQETIDHYVRLIVLVRRHPNLTLASDDIKVLVGSLMRDLNLPLSEYKLIALDARLHRLLSRADEEAAKKIDRIRNSGFGELKD